MADKLSFCPNCGKPLLEDDEHQEPHTNIMSEVIAFEINCESCGWHGNIQEAINDV